VIARIFTELDSGAQVFAVLDGARDRRIRNWVLDTHAPCWCLYRGELPAALENAAPWLLRLVPGQPYVDDFLARSRALLRTCKSITMPISRTTARLGPSSRRP